MRRTGNAEPAAGRAIGSTARRGRSQGCSVSLLPRPPNPMSSLLTTCWETICWYAAWYANWLYDLWINLTPMGYVAICLTVIGIGWLALKSGTKSFGR